MVQVERLAFGEEVVVRRGVVLGPGVVLAKEVAAVGDIGVVFVIGELCAQPLVVAQRHAGLGHEVLHVEVFVLEAVAVRTGIQDAGRGVARLRLAAGLDGGFAVVVRADTTGDRKAVDGVLGLVVDDATDGVGAVAQRSRAFQDLDLVHALDTRVVVAAVADEQAGRDGHAVFKDQRLVVSGVEAANTDVGDDPGFFLTLDVHTGNAAQRVFGGQRLAAFELLAGDDGHRAGLLGNGFFAADDHVDARQDDIFGQDPLGRQQADDGQGKGVTGTAGQTMRHGDSPLRVAVAGWETSPGLPLVGR